jgi:hypothetical protein
MDELEQKLEATGLGKNTIYQYKNGLRKYNLLFPETPFMGSEKKVYDSIKGMDKKDTTREQVLKSVVKIRTLYDMPVDKIKTIYDSVAKINIKKTKERNMVADLALPDYSDYLSWVETLPEGREYAINKLMILTSCRNADLVAEIKDNMENYSDDRNYIIVEPTRITFIRNNYKTAHLYGSKQNRFSKKQYPKLYNSIVTVSKDDNQLIPFSSVSNLSRYIQSKTNNLGETNLLKMKLKAANSLAQASRIGKARGTSLATLQSNYNLNTE